MNTETKKRGFFWYLWLSFKSLLFATVLAFFLMFAAALFIWSYQFCAVWIIRIPVFVFLLGPLGKGASALFRLMTKEQNSAIYESSYQGSSWDESDSSWDWDSSDSSFSDTYTYLYCKDKWDENERYYDDLTDRNNGGNSLW